MEEMKINRELFAKEWQAEPYPSQNEYLKDLHRLLEAYFQAALQFMRAGKADQEAAWEKRQDAVLELKRLKTYISIRAKASKESAGLIFFQAAKSWGLSEFEQFCILLGSLYWSKRNYSKFLHELRPQEGGTASWELAISLFCMADTLSQEEFGACCGRRGRWELFFQTAALEYSQTNWRLQPLILKNEMMYLFGEQRRLPKLLERSCMVWNWRKEPKELLFYQEEKNCLIRMIQGKKTGRVIGVCAGEGGGGMLMLKHISHEIHKNLLFADGRYLNEESLQEWEESLRLAAVIYDAGICLTVPWGGGNQEEVHLLAKRLLERLAGEIQPLFYTGREMLRLSSAQVKEQAQIRLPAPTLRQKTMLWEHFLHKYPQKEALDASAFAGCYAFNAGEIKQILRSAWLTAQGEARDGLRQSDIALEAARRYPDMLGDYAVRVDLAYTWEDLVIGENNLQKLRHICSLVKYRSLVGEEWGFYRKRFYGRGLCALFYGPPGTGKTMAAQVLARELGMELYRVDLSRMMSKYIGETQKNITGLFEKAKQMNAILFFDEADALFAGRTAVSDANDRHANSEVAHLLQKMEEYQGVVILATNLKDNLDDAFWRRIQVAVEFHLPDLENRKRIWRQALPKEAPTETGLDFDFFAEKFELSGSEIKEIVMQAAFLAAEKGTSLGNEQIREALALCMEKYGNYVTWAEFDEI